MMHADVRRTLVSLSASFALSWTTVSMVAGPGSAALVALSGDLSLAGAFIGLFYFAAAAGAGVVGRAMDRFGRKRGLAASHVAGAVGYAVAGWGVASAALATFVAGTIVLAFGAGGINLSRVAAAEMFPPASRGRAVAWVQVSATLGAIVGPLLLILSGPLGDALGRSPLSLVWFFAPPLLLLGAVIVSRGEEPMRIARNLAAFHPGAAAAPPPHPNQSPTRLYLTGAVSLAAALAAMAAVMGVAGAAMHHAGHGVVALGFVMFLHFVGMFGLSPVVGRVADRLGRRTTIATGLGTLAAGGGVVALDAGPWGFGLGLLIAGFGWSFAFIGASVLLTDVTSPARRARLIGRADLGAQLTAGVVAMAGGWWFAQSGIVGLGILAIVVAALPAVLLASVREPSPGSYGTRDAPAAQIGPEGA